MIAKVFLVCTALVSAGCSTVSPPRYSPAIESHVALKKLSPKRAHVLFVSDNADFNQLCRAAATIVLPDGMTAAQYVEKAFNDELKFAGIYDFAAGKAIKGELTKADFSTMQAVMSGWWDLGVRLWSGGNRPIEVEHLYHYESGFDGLSACHQAAGAFMPAVQDLIKKAVTDPRFAELMK